ncbi:collagen alpha-1(I) chain-like [Panthera tigris]|uniref:collagen alpha-1(I) chain-like n=1 Tax=Panthera tigris TaxID=9694 RepID=UPI001C6F64C4|nr:collagen alpha-1(I) chain-like [Panthera tigris]
MGSVRGGPARLAIGCLRRAPPLPAPPRSGWPAGPPVKGRGRAGLPGNGAEGGAGPGGSRGPRPRGAGLWRAGGRWGRGSGDDGFPRKGRDSPEETAAPQGSGSLAGCRLGRGRCGPARAPCPGGEDFPAPPRAARRGGPGAEGSVRGTSLRDDGTQRVAPERAPATLPGHPAPPAESWARHSRCAQGQAVQGRLGWAGTHLSPRNSETRCLFSCFSAARSPSQGSAQPLSRIPSPPASPNLGRPRRPAHLAPPAQRLQRYRKHDAFITRETQPCFAQTAPPPCPYPLPCPLRAVPWELSPLQAVTLEGPFGDHPRPHHSTDPTGRDCIRLAVPRTAPLLQQSRACA